MTPFERLKKRLAGRMPVMETPKVDWQGVILAQGRKLYSGAKAPHIPLMRSGKEGFKRG